MIRCVKRLAVLLLVLPVPGVRAESFLVVNVGPHASAEVAGLGEARVNWLDADRTDDTICTECYAALELQRYLRKLTGRAGDFSIIDDDSSPEGELILVGGPGSNAASQRWAGALGVDAHQLDELGPQGYRLKTATVDGRRVTLIAGGGRVGTLYGAYDLLYRQGCRWFAPGELHEEVPSVQRLGDVDVTERPAFATRGFLAWQDRGDREFLLWMARNRLNEWCVEQGDHPLMCKLGIQMDAGLHDAELRFLNPGSPYPYNHPRVANDDGQPSDPYPAGDQYQGDANQDGQLSYFEAHPEWFAFEGGRRIPGIQGWFGTNFCTSNPHATGEFLKNFLLAIIDGPYRDAGIIRFWTLDAGKWCQCESCRALGIPTDRNLLLVHRLDQEIKHARAQGKIHRPLVIHFLAYADVLDPPTRPLPPEFDYQTCIATFFPIVRCYVHNFDDPACPKNAHYLQQMQGWATASDRHFRGQICLGEYYNVSGYKCLPICFMHTMAHDIPCYHKLGARHFHYMHVTTGDWGTKALTNYQMARQIWDVDTDCEALWQDYFTRRYGPGAEDMRRFYESLEKTLANVSELKYGLARRLDRGVEELFPASHLRYRREPGVTCDGITAVEIVEHAATARKVIDQVRAGDLPERIARRVAEDERTFTYAEQTIAYYHACVQAFQHARGQRQEEARRHYAEARRLADLLRQDTTSTTLSSEHANAPNALAASGAAGALEHLAKLLGPPHAATK